MERPPSPDRRAVDATGIDFTDRDIDILQLIASGWTNEEIATELHLSAPTVKNEVRALYRKIGVDDRIRAVMWGAQHGLVEGLAPTRPTEQA